VISLVFGTAVGICAVAQSFIIAGAIRATPRAGDDRTLPRSSRAVEIGWTIVPAIGLALLLVFTHRAVVTGGRADAPAPASAMHSP
jgi:heme/copper-type cytochrome/quinol oxidase subunit 2